MSSSIEQGRIWHTVLPLIPPPLGCACADVMIMLCSELKKARVIVISGTMKTRYHMHLTCYLIMDMDIFKNDVSTSKGITMGVKRA